MAATRRLDRLLANLGYGSRPEVDRLIRARRVVLDGAVVTDPDRRLPLTPDLAVRLVVDQAPLDPLPGVVIMMHKPLGVTCSHRESGGLIYDLLPSRWRRRKPPLSSIGRLDRETSGLLLLTDDGPLLHRLGSPKHWVPKRYLANLARALRGDEGEIFGSGTMVLDREITPLLPADFEPIGPRSARVTIREGRYHQVRRMFAAVGNHVESLHREAVGALTLPDSLRAGSFAIVSPGDVSQISGSD